MYTKLHIGKDNVVFVSREDHEKPSTIVLEEDEDEAPGLILKNGDINWECPCLGGMATGPCGSDFRDAFSCFHYSESEPKGSECFEAFKSMQTCMSSYPELYGDDDATTEDEKNAAVDEAIAKLDLDNTSGQSSNEQMSKA